MVYVIFSTLIKRLATYSFLHYLLLFEAQGSIQVYELTFVNHTRVLTAGVMSGLRESSLVTPVPSRNSTLMDLLSQLASLYKKNLRIHCLSVF